MPICIEQSLCIGKTSSKRPVRTEDSRASLQFEREEGCAGLCFIEEWGNDVQYQHPTGGLVSLVGLSTWLLGPPGPGVPGELKASQTAAVCEM